MSRTRPVEMSIQAVSPLSNFAGATASAGFGSAEGGVSAARMERGAMANATRVATTNNKHLTVLASFQKTMMRAALPKAHGNLHAGRMRHGLSRRNSWRRKN